MRRIIANIAFVATAATLAFCSKDATVDEQIVSGERLVQLTVSASVEDTRVSFDYDEGEAEFAWENDDVIAVYDGTAIRQFSIASMSEDQKTATFTGSVAESASSCCAVYPYSALSVDDKALVVSIPSVQNPELGDVDHAALVSVSGYQAIPEGETKNIDFVLKKIYTIGRVDIEQDDFAQVEFKGIHSEAISGAYSYNPTVSPATVTSTAASNDYIVIAPVQADKGEYFFTYIPTSFTEGIAIMPLKDGARAIRRSTKIFEPVVGRGTNFGIISGLDWVSDHITTAAELTAWATIAPYAYSSYDTVYIDNGIDYGGEYWSWPDVFYGNFDGQNNCISNIKIKSSSKVLSSKTQNSVGFIGSLMGTMRNLVFGSLDGTTYDGVSSIVFDSAANGVTNCVGVVGELHSEVSDITNYAMVVVDAMDSNGVEMVNSVVQGGVVGYAGKGDIRITDCVNKGQISNNAKCTGTKDYTPGMGGVLGLEYSESTSFVMDGCQNWGDIVNNCDSSTQEVHVGGVVGFFSNAGTIQNCTNDGTIHNYGEPLQSDGYSCRVGGVIGSVGSSKDKELVKCVNNGEVNSCVHTQKSHITVGGVMGSIVGANTIVKGCANTGNLFTRDSMDLNTTIGGICGYVNKIGVMFTKADDGTHCLNRGTIHNALSTNWTVFGGIVSYVNVETDNTDHFGIEYCDNEGHVIIGEETDSTIFIKGKLYVGGIIGREMRKNSTIRNCSNSGKIVPYAILNSSTYMGGINGTMEATGTIISDCMNSGTIIFQNTNTKASIDVYVSGISSFNKGQILRCENKGQLYTTCNGNNAVKFAMGGITAASSGNNPTLIKECANSGQMGCGHGTSGTYIGGIIGYLRPNKTKIEDCTNTGYINISRTNSLKYGGLVGYCNVDQVTEDTVAATNCTLSYSLKVPCEIYGGFVVGCLAYPGAYKIQFGTPTAPINVKGTVTYTTGYSNDYSKGWTIAKTTLNDDPTSAGYYKNYLSGFHSPNSEYAFTKTVGNVTISHELNPNFVFNAVLIK